MKEYDYSSKDAREKTALALFEKSKNEKGDQETEWKRYLDYYNGNHQTQNEIGLEMESKNIAWTPATVPDCFIQVESQIDPIVPEPEFSGRDDDMDSQKAKQREYVVKFILQNNDLESKNTKNERRLLIFGDAFWKVGYDPKMPAFYANAIGDIYVKDVPLGCVFPDPSATSLQDGEFVNYSYRLHRREAHRVFKDDLKKIKKTIEEIGDDGAYHETEIFAEDTTRFEDTIQVLEHWYKDDDGDIACSILLSGYEVRHISKYWKRTRSQNKLFPFVHYWRIYDETKTWNKSELASIIDLVDAADRELAYGILNDAFMANDIILMDEDALADGEEFTNAPGAVVHKKPGKMVQRLGGISSLANRFDSIQRLQEQIQRSARNYDSNNGSETSKVTTASGLAQLRADAQAQDDIKGYDRMQGFKRLFQLVDWTALEFYDDDRVIYIGATDKKKKNAIPPGQYNLDENAGNIVFQFNSDNIAIQRPDLIDEKGKLIKRPSYFPIVDVNVIAGKGANKSKAFTTGVLDKLSTTQVTPENYKLLSALVEILDIPQKQEIVDMWEQRFNGMPNGQQIPPQMQGLISGLSPQAQAAIQKNPNLIQMAQ